MLPFLKRDYKVRGDFIEENFFFLKNRHAQVDIRRYGWELHVTISDEKVLAWSEFVLPRGVHLTHIIILAKRVMRDFNWQRRQCEDIVRRER